MPLAAPNVMLVAGRPAHCNEAWWLRLLFARLEDRSLEIPVLSMVSGEMLADRTNLPEYPGSASSLHVPSSWRRFQLRPDLKVPDLLHVTQGSMARVGIGLAERWRIPYVQSVEEFIEPGGRLPISRRWCRALVVSSLELADHLAHKLGVPKSLIRVVPPAVPIESKNKDESHVRSDPQHVPVVGASGRFVEGSGLAVFLKAVRRVIDAGVDAEFVIAGRGPREAELRRGTERLRIADRVTFADDPTSESIFWNVLDLFCLTSLVPTTGRGLLICWAHGVPSIASDVPGVRSLLADEPTSVRVPPGDADALADAIISLLGDPVGRRELAQHGRDRVAHSFDPAREARLLSQLYLAVINSVERRSAPLAASG